MSYNDYLNDPKVEYPSGHIPRYGYAATSSLQSSDEGLLRFATTKMAIILFVLSFAVFFTLGLMSSIMWLVSMLIGIAAHIVAFIGAVRAKASVLSIVVAIITAIPAYLSCLFLFIGVVMQIDRMTG